MVKRSIYTIFLLICFSHLAQAQLISIYNEDKNKIYQLSVTQQQYSPNDDHSSIVKAEIGFDWSVAEWRNLKNNFNSADDSRNLADFISELPGSPSVTVDGSKFWSNTSRFYGISAHYHNKPGYYLAHDSINSYMVSLGSWYDNRYILADRYITISELMQEKEKGLEGGEIQLGSVGIAGTIELVENNYFHDNKDSPHYPGLTAWSHKDDALSKNVGSSAPALLMYYYDEKTGTQKETPTLIIDGKKDGDFVIPKEGFVEDIEKFQKAFAIKPQTDDSILKNALSVHPDSFSGYEFNLATAYETNTNYKERDARYQHLMTITGNLDGVEFVDGILTKKVGEAIGGSLDVAHSTTSKSEEAVITSTKEKYRFVAENIAQEYILPELPEGAVKALSDSLASGGYALDQLKKFEVTAEVLDTSRDLWGLMQDLFTADLDFTSNLEDRLFNAITDQIAKFGQVGVICTEESGSADALADCVVGGITASPALMHLSGMKQEGLDIMAFGLELSDFTTEDIFAVLLNGSPAFKLDGIEGDVYQDIAFDFGRSLTKEDIVTFGVISDSAGREFEMSNIRLGSSTINAVPVPGTLTLLFIALLGITVNHLMLRRDKMTLAQNARN